MGSRLLVHVLEQFRAAGYQGVQADCEDFNDAACKFFESHVWHIIGTEPHLPVPGVTVGTPVYSRRLETRGGRKGL